MNARTGRLQQLDIYTAVIDVTLMSMSMTKCKRVAIKFPN
jgi:hypothetical protein